MNVELICGPRTPVNIVSAILRTFSSLWYNNCVNSGIDVTSLIIIKALAHAFLISGFSVIIKRFIKCKGFFHW